MNKNLSKYTENGKGKADMDKGEGSKNDTEGILFHGAAHQDFYLNYLKKCRYQDIFHKALVYSLGIDQETRKHIHEIYDFNTGCVNTRCLRAGWQTGQSRKAARLAFGLYCNGTPSVYDYEDEQDQIMEARSYAVSGLFCCSYAPYFWEAVKIRYPKYCG